MHLIIETTTWKSSTAVWLSVKWHLQKNLKKKKKGLFFFLADYSHYYYRTSQACLRY